VAHGCLHLPTDSGRSETIQGATPVRADLIAILMSLSKETATGKIDKHRDELEELSQTDLPAADLASALLEVTEE